MKKDIHPKFLKKNVTCVSCNTNFEIFSTSKSDIKIDVCSNCHPFYTGKMVGKSRAGRIERFNKKYK